MPLRLLSIAALLAAPALAGPPSSATPEDATPEDAAPPDGAPAEPEPETADEPEPADEPAPRCGRSPIEGSLYGAATDEAGLPIPGVDVSLQPLSGGAQVRAETDAEGRYCVALPPGGYWLAASRSAFTPLMRRDVQVLLGQETLVDLTLSVDASRIDEIILLEIPIVVETERSWRGVTWEREHLERLPR